MFLSRLGANDPRFRTLTFKPGLNILVADRTENSDQGDSRNGTGKTSFVRIIRYLMGGSLADELKAAQLQEHIFRGEFHLPSANGEAEDTVLVERPVKPQTQLSVSGWSRLVGGGLHVTEWREILGSELFAIPADVIAPTPGQLWGALLRTYFGEPTKGHPTDPNWVSGVKLGYFLGLSPEVLGRAGEVEKLRRQQKAIRSAVREGALGSVSLDEADLRAQLVAARRSRERTERNLRSFQVDEQYAEHQARADALSTSIRNLNDEALALDRRRTDLELAVEETEESRGDEVERRLARLYAEVGLVLPGAISRRYEEVARFHESVVRNRRTFLQQELTAASSRLERIGEIRRVADAERADVMRLLSEGVALATFVDAQAALVREQSIEADLERRLESAARINEIDNTIAVRQASTVAGTRAEVDDHEAELEAPIGLFSELGSEIYADREAKLRVGPTHTGLLSVEPHVPGDASEGIRGVETFLLDIVCLASGLAHSRAPRILVHDSHLFDGSSQKRV